MGNREDLLDGAKRCLHEKGYTRTTARDIAAASGVSLAAIGYHFGSKDALMNAAMLVALEEFGDELADRLGHELSGDATALERFEYYWSAVIDLLPRQAAAMASSFEMFTQINGQPQLRAVLAEGVEQGRSGIAAILLGVEEADVDERTIRTVGSLYEALMSGIIAQWLIDPDRAPTGADLADGLRTIAAAIQPGAPADPSGTTAP